MIISRTPFRISFFGGGTDFPDYYHQHGGATLSTTINKYCYLNVHQLGLLFDHRYRASYSKTEWVQNPSEFQHPLIRETLTYLNIDQPTEVSHSSDLPGRTGLGSSSAFTVGLLHALYHYTGREVTPAQLATNAIEIERVRVGDAGGHQDQYAAAFGGLIHTTYAKDGSVSVSQLDLQPNRIQALRDHCLVLYTGLADAGESVLCEQTKKIPANSANLAQMTRMVGDAATILTTDTDLSNFGSLLHESWELKKTLSSTITNELIDKAYTTCRANGAIGGKLLGAGGRGFLLIFAPPETHERIKAAVPHHPPIDIQINSSGSQIIFTDHTPS